MAHEVGLKCNQLLCARIVHSGWVKVEQFNSQYHHISQYVINLGLKWPLI